MKFPWRLRCPVYNKDRLSLRELEIIRVTIEKFLKHAHRLSNNSESVK